MAKQDTVKKMMTRIAQLESELFAVNEARKRAEKDAAQIEVLERRIIVYEADENGLRETIGHLNKALEALNGVTP